MRIVTKPKIVLFYLNWDEVIGKGDLGTRQLCYCCCNELAKHVFVQKHLNVIYFVIKWT